MLIKTEGLVLKQRNIGENDRMIVILTKDRGIIEASARGVKRIKSPLAGATQVLCYSQFCIFQGKKYDTINSAETVYPFYSLRLDVEKLALATYFCDLTSYLSPHGESSWGYLRFLLNTLYLLEQDKKDAVLLKSIFELRMLSLGGFMPDLTCCCDCMKYEDTQMYFDPVACVLLCSDCVKNHSNSNEIRYTVPPAVLYAMRHIIYSDENKVFQFSLKGDSLKQLEFITENYAKIQIDYQFKSLEIYKQMR
jgi:DNA repair protein RecO (recombination protein O)